MKKILVSLTSEQTIPNTLFILDGRLDFDLYYFVTTDKMERLGKTAMVTGACCLPPNRIKIIKVVEDSLNDLIGKFTSIGASEGDQFVLNLTGGTKLMTLCAYKYFSETVKYNCEIYYLPIGKNCAEKVYPFSPDQKYFFPIEYRIGLQKYLKAVGLEVLPQSRMNRTFANRAMARAMLSHYLRPDFYFPGVMQLRNILNGMSPEFSGYVNMSEKHDAARLIRSINYFDINKITRHAIEYISSSWFEEFAYYEAMNALGTGEKFIGQGVTLERDDNRNEFDVLFVDNNSLHVIECKTGLKNDKGKSILPETIYKAAALNKNFGLHTKSFIMTLDKDLRGANGELKTHHLKRSAANGVGIADRKIVANDDSLKMFFRNMLKR